MNDPQKLCSLRWESKLRRQQWFWWRGESNPFSPFSSSEDGQADVQIQKEGTGFRMQDKPWCWCYDAACSPHWHLQHFLDYQLLWQGMCWSIKVAPWLGIFYSDSLVLCWVEWASSPGIDFKVERNVCIQYNGVPILPGVITKGAGTKMIMNRSEDVTSTLSTMALKDICVISTRGALVEGSGKWMMEGQLEHLLHAQEWHRGICTLNLIQVSEAGQGSTCLNS